MSQISPRKLGDQAASNLAYIRGAMQRAQPFTGMSGVSMIVMGLLGVAAGGGSLLVGPASSAWFSLWVMAGIGAFAIGCLGLWWKSRALYGSSWRGAGSRFVYALFPAIAAGGVLSLAAALHGATELLPVIWLACYGAGVFAAGLNSIRAISAMGALFLLGAVVTAVYPAASDMVLMLTFGALHVAVGTLIMAKHGG